MEQFDEKMKLRAVREDCPVPEGFYGRLRETLEELPEEEVPLAKVPKTGDGSHGALWTAMGFLSMIGLAALSLLKPKKDEE